MKKLFTLIAMCLLSVGAMQADGWSYDFYTQAVTNEATNATATATLSSDVAFQVQVGSGSTASFCNVTAWGTTSIAVPSTNFAIVKGGDPTLQHVYSSQTTCRTGLYFGSGKRVAIQNLVAGQRITIKVNQSGVMTLDNNENILTATNTPEKVTESRTCAGQTRNVDVYTYTYDVTANGAQVFSMTAGATIYSIDVEDVKAGLVHKTAVTKRWDFGNMTLPYADNSIWTSNGTKSVKNVSAITTATELTGKANSESTEATTFTPTSGLKFITTSNVGDIQLYSSYIYFAHANCQIQIPNAKLGQLIKVRIQAGDTGRGFVENNRLSNAMTVSSKNTWETLSATVVEGGTITLKVNNPISIMSIEIYDPEYYGLNISSIGWASMCLPIKATIPEGLKVYYASSSSSTAVTLTETTTSIAASQAVMVQGAEGLYKFTIPEKSPSALEGNLFKGVFKATDFDNSTIYVLAGAESGLPYFQLYADDTSGATKISLPAYRAYLPKDKVPSAAKGGVINFVFDGGTTAINAVSSSKVQVPGTRKAMVNGKMVVITANGTYNVAGARIK